MYELDVRKTDDLVDYIDRARKHSDEYLGEWRENAALNLAWVSGDQDRKWSSSLSRTVVDPLSRIDLRTVDMHINWLRKYIVNQIIRMIQSPVTWRATPMTNDPADVDVADGIDRLLRYIWKHLRINSPDNLMTGLWNSFATGVAYAEVSWDQRPGMKGQTITRDEQLAMLAASRSSLGVPFKPSENLDDTLEDFLEQNVLGENGVSGAIRHRDGSIVFPGGEPNVRFLSGFEVIEDPGPAKWFEKESCIVRRYMPVSLVRKFWPRTGGEVVAESDNNFHGMFDLDRAADLMGSTVNSPAFEMVEVDTLYWRRGSIVYPQGRMAHVVGKTVLENGELPYTHLSTNLIPLYEAKDPNKVRPATLCSTLRKMQAGINQLTQMIMEHIGRTVKADILAAKKTIDLRTFMVTTPGVQWWDADKGPKPEFMDLPNLPPHVIQMRDVLTNDFRELAGLQGPSQGTPSSQATSGRAILALQDRFDRAFAMAASNYGTFQSDLGTAVLSVWGQFVPDGVNRMITGRDGEQSLLAVTGESLIAKMQNDGRPGALKFDINVELGPPRNTQTAIDEVTWRLEVGLADAVADAETIEYAIQTGDMSRFDKGRADRRLANGENEMFRMISDMVTNQEVPPDPNIMQMLFERAEHRPGENDRIHLDVHRRLTLSEAWMDIPRQVRDLITLHIAKHEFAVAQQNAAGLLPGSPNPIVPPQTPGVSAQESFAAGGK